jgi:glucose-6-phosphate 1-dehydrogenase
MDIPGTIAALPLSGGESIEQGDPHPPGHLICLPGLPEARLEVLRAVHLPCGEEAVSRSRRARYTAGRPAGAEVPDYVAEPGVDPERSTETFAEVLLHVDNEQWRGTRFVMRAGKALAERRKGVLVKFRPVASAPGEPGALRPAAQLWIGIEGPCDIELRLPGAPVAPDGRLRTFTLSGEPPQPGLPAYGRVLLDVLQGGRCLAVRAEEAEEAWRILTPVLEAWKDGRVPLQEYEAGSAPPADHV